MRHEASTAFTFAVAVLTISACGPTPPTPEERAAQAIADASSPESMWYRYSFEGDYQGEPIKLEQMVYCPIRSFSGGSLGQSTGFSVRAQHPMTVAQQMGDGSQVLIRIPDVCQRFRAYKEGEGYQQGWESPQVIDVLPYVIWSDAYPDASRIEAYVSPAYYDHSEARLAIKSSQVHLLPLGSYPDDFEDVVRTNHALPYLVNPPLDEYSGNQHWLRYHRQQDSLNEFVSLFVVPISDLNSYGRQFMLDRPELERNYILDEEEGFSDPVFAAYDEVSAPTSGTSDPAFVSHDCVSTQLDDILGGQPLQTSMPYDRLEPSWYKNPGIVQSWEEGQARKANCRDRLAQLRSFEIVEGRFDASQSVPGAMVFNRWGRNPADEGDEVRFGPLKLQQMSVVGRQGYKMTLDGQKFTYKINDKAGYVQSNIILKNKSSDQWYMIEPYNRLIIGDGEDNYFK
jgi:hypothetical protein